MYYPETETTQYHTTDCFAALTKLSRHEYMLKLDTHPELQTKPIMNKPTTPEVTLSDKLVKIIAFSEDGQVLVTKDHQLPFSYVRTTPNLQAQILFYTMVYQSSENGKLVLYKTQGNVSYYLYTDVVLKVNAGLVGSTFKESDDFLGHPRSEGFTIQQAYKHFLSLQTKQKEPLKLSTSNLQSLIALVSSSITDKETSIKEAKELVGVIPKDYLEDKTELFKYIQSEQQKIKKLVQIQTTMKRLKSQG